MAFDLIGVDQRNKCFQETQWWEQSVISKPGKIEETFSEFLNFFLTKLSNDIYFGDLPNQWLITTPKNQSLETLEKNVICDLTKSSFSLTENARSNARMMVLLQAVHTVLPIPLSPALPKRAKVNALVTLSTFFPISPMVKKFQKPPSFAPGPINHSVQLARNSSALNQSLQWLIPMQFAANDHWFHQSSSDLTGTPSTLTISPQSNALPMVSQRLRSQKRWILSAQRRTQRKTTSGCL